MTLATAIVERLKRTALIWLAVYPSVLLVLSLVGDCFRHWSLPMRVLAATLIVVPLVVNISSPLIQAVMDVLGKVLHRIKQHDDKQ
ncbi:hypothetical protein D3C81_609290 [compost metagenome]